MIPDRIEAATLLLAGAITGGDVRITRVCPAHLTNVVDSLRLMGFQIESGSDWIRLCASDRPRPIELRALPYPGLPTDLQAQFTAVLALAKGQSLVRDCVFPHRFQHVPELVRLGANLTRRRGAVSIDGVSALGGSQLRACDLRASAALALAALAAQGRTVVRGLRHLDRGYEALDRKLSKLGALVERVDSVSRAAAGCGRRLMGRWQRDFRWSSAGLSAGRRWRRFVLTSLGRSPRLKSSRLGKLLDFPGPVGE